MERIKEALERARQQRAAGPPQPLEGGRAAGAGTGTGGATAPAGDITYTQTRTVTLEPGILRSNRLYPALQLEGAKVAYRILRTQVLQRLQHKGWNTVAVTSAGDGEGKTLTAVNLAMSLAQEVNHTVLLADLDLRHPAVHKALGLEPQIGVSDIMLNGASVGETLVNPGIERLVVLPGREPIVASSEMLSSPAMVRLVEDLKTRYPKRIVLFDLPPVLSADDALAFSPYVDCVLLVVEDGATTQAQLRQTLDYLGGTNLLGTVLNKAEEAPTAAYGY